MLDVNSHRCSGVRPFRAFGIPAMTNPLTSRMLVWAEGLRFPKLFMITAVLFVADLLIPDFIPFIDEILLGLGTLLLGNLRRGKRNVESTR